MTVSAMDYALAARIAGEQILYKRRLDPWAKERREAQTPPPGDWRTWLVMAGRGFGKTRTGAEWVREQALQDKHARIALVGPTAADVRDVMVESLLVACARYEFYPRWAKSERRLDFPNGARAWTYSAEEPDRLRGPQHTHAWSDEVAAWNYPETWDMLQFGLRLGGNPQQVATTTPRPVPIVKDLLSQRESGAVVVTTGSSYDNAANLAPAFVEQIIRRYEGTRLGRQEIHAELLLDVPGALWTYDIIEDARVAAGPDDLDWQRIVIGVDPAVTNNEDSSETGIIVAGRGLDNEGYVVEDLTLRGSPLEWAHAVVEAYDRWRADRVVAEVNNGGLMVEQTLRTVRPNLPITLVRASRGKLTRAEPVAALYEQGHIHHVGGLPQLEDQMTSYDGTGDSPDRMDACLVAGTLVKTSRGDIPIESVVIGDSALTRGGWRTVSWSGMTSSRARVRTVELSNGAQLTGTNEHPIFVPGRGFVALDALVWGDILSTCESDVVERLFDSRESDTQGFLMPIGRTRETITGPLGAVAKTRFTAKSGSPSTDRFQRGATFTTKIGTRSTTIRPISFVSHRNNMPQLMLNRFASRNKRGLIRFAPSLRSGMDHPKVLPGILSMASKDGSIARLNASSATGAEKRRIGSLLDATSITIAVVVAIVLPLMLSTATTLMRSVLFAERRSSKTNTAPSQKRVPVFVVRNYESGEAPVYNLTVSEQPEFFANGVLVHNCVWALTDLMIGRGSGEVDPAIILAFSGMPG